MNTFPWEDLPPETADLIVQALVRQLRRIEDDPRGVATHRARLISHAFKDAVGHLWKLHPPLIPVHHPGRGWKNLMQCKHVATFVDGVVRYAADAVAGRFRMSTNTYSTLYTTVNTWCTQKPPYNGSPQMYDCLHYNVHALVADGTLRHIDTQEKRDVIFRLLGHIFKYLDRFYVKRLSLPEVSTVVREAFVN